MGKVNPAREAALKSLLKMKSGKYTNLEVNATLTRADMSAADRGLYTALVYGVRERIITLDKIIEKYSKVPLSKIDAEALAALRLGIYQLAFMSKIPDHAAVDESVTLAGRKAGGRRQGAPHGVGQHDGVMAQTKAFDKPAVQKQRADAVRAHGANGRDLLMHAIVACSHSRLIPAVKRAPETQLIRPYWIGVQHILSYRKGENG